MNYIIKVSLVLFAIISIFAIEIKKGILSKSEFVFCRFVFLSYFDFLPFSIDMLMILYLGFPMLTITYSLNILKKYTRISKQTLLRHHFTCIFYYVLAQLLSILSSMTFLVCTKSMLRSPYYFATFNKEDVPAIISDVINISLILSSIVSTTLNYLTMNMFFEFLKLNIKLRQDFGEIIIDKRVMGDILWAICLHVIPNSVLYGILVMRLVFILPNLYMLGSIILYGMMFGFLSSIICMNLYRWECGWILSANTSE